VKNFGDHGTALALLRTRKRQVVKLIAVQKNGEGRVASVHIGEESGWRLRRWRASSSGGGRGGSDAIGSIARGDYTLQWHATGETKERPKVGPVYLKFNFNFKN
jgi:hypothetical protein